MTPDESPGGDEHASRLLAVVHLLAEMAMQTLKQGEADAARGFVDSIETLQVKTKGNVGDAEKQAFESLLYQLRMAVLHGPPPAQGEGEGDGNTDANPEGETPAGTEE